MYKSNRLECCSISTYDSDNESQIRAHFGMLTILLAATRMNSVTKYPLSYRHSLISFSVFSLHHDSFALYDYMSILLSTPGVLLVCYKALVSRGDQSVTSFSLMSRHLHL